MKIAILGYGREGRSVWKFLKRSPEYRRAPLTILDQKRDPNYLKHLSEFDLVFRSPGVPYNLPQIQKAIKAGVKISSATKLFFDEANVILRRGSRLRQGFGGQAGTIIGVTGTKGKGTTSTLIYKILKASGKNVLLAGNIGKPALEILPKIKKGSIVILELSSFQLQDLKRSPHIAVVTDTFPDHLDAHKNMREYVDAKSNITKYQKKSDAIFYFQDNKLSTAIAQKSPAETKIGFDGAPFGLKKNYLMASMVAAYLGCPTEIIHRIVKNFRGLEHRLEPVRTMKVNSNILKNLRIDFYNDSASTNPQTAAAAVLSLSKDHLILIAGGKDKNLDYSPLAEAVKKSANIKEVILFGESKMKIKKSLRRGTVVKDLKSAVALAYKNSKTLMASGCTRVAILFSPAAASFDMFRDYADRGKQFKKIVKSLK